MKLEAYTLGGAYICTVQTQAKTRDGIIRALRSKMARERVSSNQVIRLFDFNSREGGEIMCVNPYEME